MTMVIFDPGDQPCETPRGGVTSLKAKIQAGNTKEKEYGGKAERKRA